MSSAVMCDHCHRAKAIPDQQLRHERWARLLPAGWFSLVIDEHTEPRRDFYEPALAGDFCSFRCAAHHMADELDRQEAEAAAALSRKENTAI